VKKIKFTKPKFNTVLYIRRNDDLTCQYLMVIEIMFNFLLFLMFVYYLLI